VHNSAMSTPHPPHPPPWTQVGWVREFMGAKKKMKASLATEEKLALTGSPSSSSSSSSSSSAVVAQAKPSQVYLKSEPPQKVIEEDDYIDAMSEIIQRDFFPDLKKLYVSSFFLSLSLSLSLFVSLSFSLSLFSLQQSLSSLSTISLFSLHNNLSLFSLQPLYLAYQYINIVKHRMSFSMLLLIPTMFE
jgi:hypothetical protein